MQASSFHSYSGFVNESPSSTHRAYHALGNNTSGWESKVKIILRRNVKKLRVGYGEGMRMFCAGDNGRRVPVACHSQATNGKYFTIRKVFR